mgnify:CR=1 FL=1
MTIIDEQHRIAAELTGSPGATVAEATAGLEVDGVTPPPLPEEKPVPKYAESDEGPGRIVRTKVHSAAPMSVDDALYHMELVGHDFFLFHDKESDRPSVVYRRHAYDYGLIRLS